MELIIAANWKMHKTVADAIEFCRALKNEKLREAGVEILICPPFTALAGTAEQLQGTKIKLGAQNMHWAGQGAYTGEISAGMLLETGVEYVILGHSERRHIMGEDDRMIGMKVKAAIEQGLKPILCVGETDEERRQGATETVLKKQLHGALEHFAPEAAVNLVIAYEPVWAIGSGKAATTEDAEGAAAYILSLLADQFGAAAEQVRVQYGGSVKAENIGSFVSLPSVSGALIGGASLEAASFAALIEAARKAVNS